MGLKCRIFGHNFPVHVSIPAGDDDVPKLGKYEFPRECFRCGAKGVLHVNVTKKGTTVLVSILEERLILKIILSDKNDTPEEEKKNKSKPPKFPKRCEAWNYALWSKWRDDIDKWRDWWLKEAQRVEDHLEKHKREGETAAIPILTCRVSTIREIFGEA